MKNMPCTRSCPYRRPIFALCGLASLILLIPSPAIGSPKFKFDDRGRFPWFSLTGIAAQTICLGEMGLLPKGVDSSDYFFALIQKDLILNSFFYRYPVKAEFSKQFFDDVDRMRKEYSCPVLLEKKFF